MRQLDWLHRWTGGLIGLVLAVLGLSGTVLLHRDAWITLPHSTDALVADNFAVVAAIERIMADPTSRPASVLLASESFGLHRLSWADDSGAYASQAGHVIARWQSPWERPELFLFDLHHHLLAAEAGEIVIGMAGLFGLFFIVSGVILWWRTRRTFRLRMLPARLSRSAILWHHRDLGIIVAPLPLLTIYTGTTMIFRPVTSIALGSSAPATIASALKPPQTAPASLADKPHWRAMIRTAKSRFLGAEIRLISLPRQEGGPIMMRAGMAAQWTHDAVVRAEQRQDDRSARCPSPI